MSMAIRDIHINIEITLSIVDEMILDRIEDLYRESVR